MPSLLSKENWLKGVLGLGIVKDALIPTLRRHYLQKAKEWSTDDDHLTHLLYLGATKEVKQMKQREGKYIWNVNCSECRLLLKLIEMSHRQPARLMWMNNQMKDSCPKEYRLARIFMSAGNENTRNYSDLDALAVLEILKNDISFRHSYNEILFLILFRNRLMHSSNYFISGDDLEAAFYQMKKLLQEDKFKNLEECITAVEELDKLQKKNLICDLDEYSENWKKAIDIQEQALKYEGIEILGSQEINLLLTQIQNELQKEYSDNQKLKSKLSNSEKQREYERRQRILEDKRARTSQKMLESQLEETNCKHQTEMQKCQADNDKLQEKINKMLKQNPSISKRIMYGSMTGSGVGIVGGPVGSAIGGAAGGLVGGISYLWDKIRN